MLNQVSAISVAVNDEFYLTAVFNNNKELISIIQNDKISNEYNEKHIGKFLLAISNMPMDTYFPKINNFKDIWSLKTAQKKVSGSDVLLKLNFDF